MEEKTSLIIDVSIVDELLTLAGFPSGAVNICSGEVDGLVSRKPPWPGINQSKRKEEQLSSKGYALFLRKSCISPEKRRILLIVSNEFLLK